MKQWLRRKLWVWLDAEGLVNARVRVQVTVEKEQLQSEYTRKLETERATLNRVIGNLARIQVERSPMNRRLRYAMEVDDRLLLNDLNDRSYLIEHICREFEHQFNRMIRK